MSLLRVQNLQVVFPSAHGALRAIRDISFDLAPGERIGIVGESGAGKSVAAFAILNLIAKPGYLAGGRILFDGQNLAAMNEQAMRQVRGNQISMIFQEPMMTLNPVLTIGAQMIETIRAHQSIGKKQAEQIALQKLQAVQIPSARERLRQYPHELSGGMRQRVVIAIALCTEPRLIIADEPTTALDVTIQAEILRLLAELCADFSVGLLLITHDLGVVNEITQRVLVMYAGRIIERGATFDVINAPAHPYTRGLIDALPGNAVRGQPLNQIPGAMPTLAQVPSGCAFHPRCAYAQSRCREQIPLLPEVAHAAACHTPLTGEAQ